MREGGAPQIEITDTKERSNISLNTLFDELMLSKSKPIQITIKDIPFEITHVKIDANVEKNHNIVLCAANRAVTTIPLKGRLPGLYGSIIEKYDASETFKAFIMNLFLEFFTKGANPIHTDMLVSLKTLLTKSEAWSYEKEWRMFYSFGGTKHGIIAKLKPSAIYLGNAIESHLKNQLVETSREKGIACYQMERSLNSKKYELFPLFLL